MRRFLLVISAIFSLFAPAAHAANSTVSAMTAASAFGGTELMYIVQGAADRKGTPAQMATYVYGLASGDCTISGAGAVVCLKTNGVAFTAAATTAIGTSGATIPLLSTANTWTLGQTFSAAPTFSSISGSTQCLHVSTAGLVSGTGSDCGSGSGAVSSVTGGVGITVSPTTGAVVVSSTVTQRNNTTTSDTLLTTDSGTVVTESNASPVAVSIAAASTTGFTTGNYWTVKNKGAGLVTITPTTSTIDGAATLTVKQNQSVDFYSDGTNYWTLPGRPTNAACADLTNGATGCSTTVGTAATAATGTSGHTLPFLDGTNAFSGTQTFGSVFGTVTTQSGTTYTLAASDCGTEIAFTNAAAVTVTIPAALTTGCNIAILQTTAAGQVTVTGTAVSAATLHSAHSYTKTFGQWAIIGINIYTTGVAILTGDGA